MLLVVRLLLCLLLLLLLQAGRTQWMMLGNHVPCPAQMPQSVLLLLLHQLLLPPLDMAAALPAPHCPRFQRQPGPQLLPLLLLLLSHHPVPLLAHWRLVLLQMQT
jgi:hypothetical protein